MAENNYKNLTPAERVAKGGTAVNAVISIPEIQECFTMLGHTPEVMNNGLNLHDSVIRLMAKQVSEYGEQYAATENLHMKWAIAKKWYNRNLKLARIFLKDDPHAVTSLVLNGRRKGSVTGWCKDANLFYSNMVNNPVFIDKMSHTGCSAEAILNDHQLVKDVEMAQVKQNDESGEAQAATLARDNAIDEFLEWTAVFYEIADIALEDHPQWKERLGILERS